MVMYSCVMADGACERCTERSAALRRAEARVEELTREVMLLREQLREALKLNVLQQGDLARWIALVASLEGHRPERVARNDLQLAFDHMLESFAGVPVANASCDDVAASGESDAPSRPTAASREAPASSEESAASSTGATAHGPNDDERGTRKGHGRRMLSRTDLPVREIVIDPPEVLADGGVGWALIDAEYTERVALPHAGYQRVRIVRRKWVRVGGVTAPSIAEQLAGTVPVTQIVTAPLPDGVWPGTMGDASAIANIIVSKYDDSLPLHRQEHITNRHGFRIPRSTQCNWLEAAYDCTWRVVAAMTADGIAHSHVIATDATGAPVRARGSCDNWHVFVFIMDQGHVVFRHSAKHTGAAVRGMLSGFHGTLLSDAHSIYDVLHAKEGIVEAGDWAHGRRYFFKAIPSDRERAMQAIALIGKLFDVERNILALPPDERLRIRREESAPLVELFETWVDREAPKVEPRSPIAAALGYCANQRLALRRFLVDGRLPMHNNASEAELRKLALGRDNWMWFENETGLRWYGVFRSLISSCVLHDLPPEVYLEQLLRLAPHWPVTRALELAPKHWRQTVASLDERHRRIITPPWELDYPLVPGASLRPSAAVA